MYIKGELIINLHSALWPRLSCSLQGEGFENLPWWDKTWHWSFQDRNEIKGKNGVTALSKWLLFFWSKTSMAERKPDTYGTSPAISSWSELDTSQESWGQWQALISVLQQELLPLRVLWEPLQRKERAHPQLLCFIQNKLSQEIAVLSAQLCCAIPHS